MQMAWTLKDNVLTRRMNHTFFKGERSLHLLFWVLVYAFLVWMDPKENGILFAMGKEAIQLVFFAIIVYINLLYIFPIFLRQRNIWWHLLSLGVLALLLTPIRIALMYLLYSNQPDVQTYFITNQSDIFLSSFFVAIGSSIYNILGDWLKSQRIKQELQNQTLQSELNFLKSQINPHFLFNTLNNLYALTLKKSERAPEIVLKLSEMMRYMLYECNEREVPLAKEVNYLQNYLELEKLRQGSRFEISFTVNGIIGNQMIAPLLFIPFIENSFKHGVNHQLKEGYVNIHLYVESSSLTLTIDNSKSAAMPAPSTKKSGGIGLVNVRRRLNILYPGRYNLNVMDNPNNYEIKLDLTLAQINTKYGKNQLLNH